MTNVNTAATNAATATDYAERYYANPYSPDHSGFYFSTADEYHAGADLLRAKGCEEWDIEYIDGDEAQLFKACSIDQSNIDQWFDLQDELEDWQKPALFYLCEYNGLSLADALQQLDDCPVEPGTAVDYAERYIDDTGALESLPESLVYYFDYQAFARDMVLNGDVCEFEYDGESYVASR